jgi:hypothetical protein
MKSFNLLMLVLLIGVIVPRSNSAQEGKKIPRELNTKPAVLPKDVDAQSFSRIGLPNRDELNDAEKKSYDALDKVDKEGGVGLRGPANAPLHYPGLAAQEGMNGFLRKSSLGGAPYELAILVIGREMNAQVMYTAHEPEAIAAGVSKEAVDIVKHRKPIVGLNEEESIIIQFVREIYEKPKVTPETYARAKKFFGEKNLVLFTAGIVGRTGTPIWSRVFDQNLNPMTKPLLPMP